MIKSCGLAVVTFASSIAFAQMPASPPANDVNKMNQPKMGPDLSVADRKFVEKVASDNMAEVKMARLALDKSTMPEVKKYAQTIIDDHEKAENELRSIVKPENFPLPNQIETGQQQTMDKLQAMNGKKFDKEYLKEMVKSHDQAIDTFQKASNELTNDQLRNYATRTLPTLKEHREMAKSDMDSIKSK